MDVDTLLRRVKRDFGDEYNVVINDLDIFDWANEAQLNIIRDTTSNDTTVTRAANTFPVSITDRVKVKRVAYNNRALTHTTLPELDLSEIATTQEGVPVYWYVNNGQVNLWPTPSATNTQNLLITYSKIPTKLTLVAPYLQFHNNPLTVEYASIPADTDFDTTSVRFKQTFSIANLNQDFIFLSKGITSFAAAANFAFVWRYLGGSVAPNTFRLTYSDGATIRTTGDLVLRPATPMVANEIFSISVSYDNATGTTTLSREVGGVFVVDATDVQSAFPLSVTAGYDLTIGALEAGAVPTPSSVRVYKTSILNAALNAIYEMDGYTDLADLPTVPATPFSTISGHTMSVTGGAQIYNEDNAFSVPEVYHDDIIKYCIAKAHRKNRDYRGADDAMEEFNSSVTTRRDEANAEDTPSYKLADPFDYGWDSDSVYG